MTNKNVKASLPIGMILQDKWVILEFIARGGMGEVYRAHQLNLKRDVAIKIISRDWLGSLEGDEEDLEIALQRFRNEVQVMAQIRHPNVIHVFDYGSVDGKKNDKEIPFDFFVVEYIPGATLRSSMSEEGFYPEENLTREWIDCYFLPVLEGVQALHEAGIIHRDLKPENVLLDGRTPKISDFGLARTTRMKPVTRSVDIQGTAPYMPPEQFLDFKRTDERSDIYALGKILCETIEGKFSPKAVPFKRASLSKAETPFFQKLDRIIRQATLEEKNQRISSVKLLKERLLDALKDGRERPRPSLKTASRHLRTGRNWVVAAGLLVFIAVVVAIFYLYRQERGALHPSVPHPSITEPVQQPTPQQQQSIESTAPSRGQAPSSIKAKDGTTLRLIPGGSFTFLENLGPLAGTSVTVDTFYMDETEVTNQQYVDFLNQVLPRLRVENDTVRADSEIWLLLGEVTEGYEPIVFKEGRFLVNDPLYTAHPIVRVTAIGAAAYSSFYGMRLPTDTEWLYAAGVGSKSEETPVTIGRSSASQGWMEMEESWMEMEKMHEGVMQPPPTTAKALSRHPSPVSGYEPNAFGVRGLEANVSEWGIRHIFEKKTPTYVILGGLGSELGGLKAIQRQAWEAYEEVGFRCVQSLTIPPESP